MKESNSEDGVISYSQFIKFVMNSKNFKLDSLIAILEENSSEKEGSETLLIGEYKKKNSEGSEESSEE